MVEPVLYCLKCKKLVPPHYEREEIAQYDGMPLRELCQETPIDLVAERERLLAENAELQDQLTFAEELLAVDGWRQASNGPWFRPMPGAVLGNWGTANE